MGGCGGGGGGVCFFFFNDAATTEIYTLSLHDALPICRGIEGSFPCNISSAIIINSSQISFTQLCIYSTSYMRVTIRDVAAYPIPIQFLTTAHAYLMGQLQVI